MSAPPESHREIPFNYTSADDRLLVLQLLGEEVWNQLEALRARRVTGRSARLLLRVLGEVSIHRRNPFLFQELLDAPARRRRLARHLAGDLAVVEQGAGGDELVGSVLAATRRLVADFEREVAQAPGERQRILEALSPVVGRSGVLFDPFTLVSHATDATDWRLHLPVAVAMPTEESQVAPLLAAVAGLGLSAIPRGAGTGLTGGAVPLQRGCVVVNTEKLNRVLAVEERDFPAAGARSWTMRLEAGVITERAMEEAARRGLVFATDPTSAWACTVGGNVAENAGGKMAVLWGTCIDNLLAWRMALPSGATWTVRRVDHPLRKILPGDTVTWRVEDAQGRPLREIALRGGEVRRNGLWKDITNKALGGLPGVQKEGTDGVITSAEFVLYRQYASSATLCLEFFGPDLEEASEVVLALSRAFPNEGKEVLQALEHFDDEYVRAIGYKVKAPRAETPRAVLLVDVVGHSTEETARGVGRVRKILAPHRNTHLFVARDPAEAKRFWADRKRLGAIAARTNAFKLNEDVVLPLPALAEFARWCEQANRGEERHNQEQLIRRIAGFLEAAPAQEDAQYLPERIAQAVGRCEEALAALAAAEDRGLRGEALIGALKRDLLEYVRGYPALAAGVEALWNEVRGRLIVLATHMHAGDGNVHVNIPVMSSDRAMMRRAEWAVDRVMEMVAALGGVCSGEHGIGVTKLKYLEAGILDALAAHRRALDPRGVMNPGKLSDRGLAERIFTPSFNLLELEARILQRGNLEALALRIAKCVRCGKCKPDCCVYHPARGLFFHPRNKNLAVGALIEALLYDAQRERTTGFELLRWLGEVADHCTICHKCAKPCPVDIDTGEVSVLEREILAAHGFQRTKAATRATLSYLDSRSPAYNALFRGGVVRLGGALQRALARVVGPAVGAGPRPYPLELLRSPAPRAEARTLRDLLPPCKPDQALVLEPEAGAQATVFYFPGCGSERLHASVSMAALHLLLSTGTRVVLPPPFLCCGFPAWANAATEQHTRNVLRDTILFSQIREMFSYLQFDAVAVTCGTCREALLAMEAGEIFQAPVMDVARFALDRGLSVALPPGSLYHPPCHDSLDGKAEAVLERIGGARVERVEHCCSEAGTLALSRPDISDAMLHRKREALAAALAARPGGAVILTNCPSCLSGLGRSASLGAEPRHVAVELARALSGEGWREAFRRQAQRAQAVRF